MMVAATVVACVALVIAIGVAVGGWVFLQRNREILLSDYRSEVDLAGKTFDFRLEQLKVSQDNHDEAVESYRKMRERAQAHFLTADDDASRADRRLTELERYTRRTLEHHAATGTKPLILRGGLYVQQLPVLDIVLELSDKFLVAVGADVMYRQDDGPDGSTFYLRWPMEKAPRDQLDTLTRAVAAPCGSCGSNWSDCNGSSSGCPGRSGTASAGAAELRAVLEAVRDGGLGVLYLGPLILLRTKTCIQAGFLKPDFQRLTEAQKINAVNATGTDLLAELGVAVFLEFNC